MKHIRLSLLTVFLSVAQLCPACCGLPETGPNSDFIHPMPARGDEVSPLANDGIYPSPNVTTPTPPADWTETAYDAIAYPAEETADAIGDKKQSRLPSRPGETTTPAEPATTITAPVQEEDQKSIEALTEETPEQEEPQIAEDEIATAEEELPDEDDFDYDAWDNDTPYPMDYDLDDLDDDEYGEEFWNRYDDEFGEYEPDEAFGENAAFCDEHIPYEYPPDDSDLD